MRLWDRAPGSSGRSRGIVVSGVSLHHLFTKETSMENQEICFTKQCALATRDWDTYQAIIRTCLNPRGRQGSDGESCNSTTEHAGSLGRPTATPPGSQP